MPQYSDWTTRANTVPIVNTTNETIPAGGVVATVGDPDEYGRKRVGKPTSNGQLGCYIVGPQPILPADSEDGEPVGWATFDSPALAAYNPADGEPAIGSTWGPVAGSWLLGYGWAGFLIDGPFDELDGRVVVLRVGGETDDYPYNDGYFSYDDGDGGATWSHDSTINIGCNATTGNIIGDVVRYTHVLFVRRGRPTVSTSLEVLEEDKVLVETECKKIIDLTTLTLECVDGIPTLDYDDDYVRSIVCKACP